MCHSVKRLEIRPFSAVALRSASGGNMGNLAPGVADHGDVDTNDDFAEKHADFRRRGIEVEFTVGGLLKYVGAVHLKAVKRFVVADNFKKGNVVGSREIVWIGESFQFHYGDVVEVDGSPRIVFVWELFKRSLDEPVITILGGESDPKTEIHLAHQFQMMELGKQAHARLDGYANFGYKRSPKDGKLWVPDWDVDGEGLGGGAHSSSNPRDWRGGDRVSS